jgi:hypothetical protein
MRKHRAAAHSSGDFVQPQPSMRMTMGLACRKRKQCDKEAILRSERAYLKPNDIATLAKEIDDACKSKIPRLHDAAGCPFASRGAKPPALSTRLIRHYHLIADVSHFIIGRGGDGGGGAECSACVWWWTCGGVQYRHSCCRQPVPSSTSLSASPEP